MDNLLPLLVIVSTLHSHLDTPPIQDIMNFPGKHIAWQNHLCAKEHLEYYQEVSSMYASNRNELLPIMWDLQERMDTWETLYDIWDTKYSMSFRKRKLKELKEKLGDINYYRGVMPTPVPLHYFNRVE